jgi:hypothetical protein
MGANIEYILGEKGKDVFPAYYGEDNLIHAGHEKKVYLGERGKEFCRFCHRDPSSTKFKNDAHLLPEFTGNKILFSYFECDECNARFSKYESAFANYFNANHTFARVKGKNKIPQYKREKENFRVVPEAEETRMYAGLGNELVTIDGQTQMMTIKTIRPSYVPCDVLKCLVKIGLCAVRDRDLHYFEQTRKWLMCETDEGTRVSRPSSIIYYNIGGGLRTDSPFVVLFHKRAGMPVPQSAILIAYNHFMLQFFMPFDARDEALWNGLKVSLPIQGHVVREKADGSGLGFFWKDLSGREKVVGEEHAFSMVSAMGSS